MADLPDLIAQLSSGDDEQAQVAVEALSAWGESALPELRDLYARGDVDSRWWAVRALAEVDSVDTAPGLAVALSDPDEAVRQCAALGLRKRPDPALVLALIGDPQTIPALFAALQEDSALMEYWANEGLERMGVGMAFFKP